MSRKNQEKVDEVSRHFALARTLGFVGTLFFWVNACLSYILLFLETFPSSLQSLIPPVFSVFVSIQFITSQINRFYLIPKAEKMRRKQMLSDALGVPLSHDKTSLYYNNDYTPSIGRIAANTMENALFSYRIVEDMLFTKRLVAFICIVIWLLIFYFRSSNLDVIIYITQIVFSGEIIVQWLSLEFLRYHQKGIYRELYSYFFHKIGDQSEREIATILDLFASYEVAKSTSYLISQRTFKKLNPKITEEWKQIRSELKMNNKINSDIGSSTK